MKRALLLLPFLLAIPAFAQRNFDNVEVMAARIDIRNQVQALINRGMTLEQVKAAKPTAKYEPPYGDIYGDLKKTK